MFPTAVCKPKHYITFIWLNELILILAGLSWNDGRVWCTVPNDVGQRVFVSGHVEQDKHNRAADKVKLHVRVRNNHFQHVVLSLVDTS